MTDTPLTQEQRFELAVSYVLKHEGGFSNHASDPGGATNYGISLRFLKDAYSSYSKNLLLVQELDIDKDGDIDIIDITGLSQDKAKEIYKQFWWDKYGYNRINNLVLAIKVFDFSVNMGATQAHKLLQRSVNEVALMLRSIEKPSFPKPPILKIDGFLGEKSIEAINIGNHWNILPFLTENAADFYHGIVKNNPELSKFIKGWIRRVGDMPKLHFL